MPDDLKDAHIQDVADVLSGEYRHEELTEILRRFDAEHLRFDDDEAVDDITHVSRYNRVAHWLRESNGTPLGRELLAHLVENTQLRVDQLEALEALTTGSYNEALDELYSEGLIEKWDGNGSRETRDWRMLYTPYGYCSTIGSHTSGNDSAATLLQAQTGVIFAEEAIQYVLRIINEAEDQGIQLNRWVV